MAGPITLPAGAFAAAKAGAPQPTPTDAGGAKPAAAAPAAKPEPKADPKPKPPAKEPPKERQAAADEPPAELTAAEKKIWKLKAAGKEVEFDASDEESVKKHIEKALGADETFRTASQLRQQAEQFFEMLRTPEGARKVLTDPRIGIDLKKLAKEVVWEEIQQQQREEEWAKDPAKKEQWEREQKLKAYEDQEARTKADADAKRAEEEASRFENHYGDKIMKVLELGGIPKTPEAVSRMADMLILNVEKGLDLSPEEILVDVRQQFVGDITAVLGAADGEQLLALLGETVAKKLRDADVKRLRSPTANPFPQRSGNKKPAEAKADPTPKRKSGSEWKEDLQREFLARKK